MSRNNSSFNLVITIIIIVLFAISSAIAGEPIYLLIILGILGIWFLYVKLREPESGKKNLNTKVPDKIQSQDNVELRTLISVKKPDFTFTNNRLIGEIKGTELPSEIYDFEKITYIALTCTLPIDISTLINKHPTLDLIRLNGPFYFKNGIENKDQFYSVTLSRNPQLDNILRILSKQKKLGILDINSETELRIEQIIECCENLWDLTIRCKLTEFPLELLKFKRLKTVNLSKNKIEIINLDGFKNFISEDCGIEKLDLRNNLLRNIPFELFQINTLKKVYLDNNPLTKKCLKKLFKLHSYRVELSSEQRKIGERRFHPTTWLFIKIVLSIIAIAIPTVVFNSGGMSIIIFAFVMVAWLTK